MCPGWCEVEVTGWDLAALTQPVWFLSPRFQGPVDEHTEHGQNMYDETPARYGRFFPARAGGSDLVRETDFGAS